jgi:hypothetical protein
MSGIPWIQTVLFILSAVGIILLILKTLKSKINDNLKTVITAVLIPPFICLMATPYIPTTLDASQTGLLIDGMLGISIFALVLGRVLYDRKLDVPESALLLLFGSIGVFLVSLFIGAIDGSFISNIFWITGTSKQISVGLPLTGAIASCLLFVFPSDDMKKAAFLLMSFPGSLYLSVGFRQLASSILLYSFSPFVASAGFSYSLIGALGLSFVVLSAFTDKKTLGRILGGASATVNVAQIFLMLL